MTNTSPITPPLELVHEWADMLSSRSDHAVFSIAAQWGADQELEACCEWLSGCGCKSYGRELRAARRPKPPSLKEQALQVLRPLSNPVMPGTPEYRLYEPQAEIIRRALEALDD